MCGTLRPANIKLLCSLLGRLQEDIDDVSDAPGGGPVGGFVIGGYVERELDKRWFACRIISISTDMSSGQPSYGVRYLDDGNTELDLLRHELRPGKWCRRYCLLYQRPLAQLAPCA